MPTTALSKEALVGVKWNVQRGRRASHRRIKRGVFRSLSDLQAAETDVDPKPFLSTADPDKVLADADACRAT